MQNHNIFTTFFVKKSQFFSWIQSCRQENNAKPQQFHELSHFSRQIIFHYFSNFPKFQKKFAPELLMIIFFTFQVFNLGDYRRSMESKYSSHEIFNPENQDGLAFREKICEQGLKQFQEFFSFITKNHNF